MSEGFRLYLVRHGESQNNCNPEPQRVPDPLLTAIGQRQAHLLGQRFFNRESGELLPDLLLSSAFQRTMQTLRPTANLLDMRPDIWTDLFEVGGCHDGYLPGKTIARPGLSRKQIQAQYPEYNLPDDITDTGWYTGTDKETYAEASARAALQADKLVATFSGRDIVVLCLIHADLKGLLCQQFFPDNPDIAHTPFANTSVTLISFNATTPELLLLNDSSHLPDDLISH